MSEFWRDARGTVIVAAVTVAVSLYLLFSGWQEAALFSGGFIPLRMDGVAMPADHGFALPAWLTPLSATLIHGGIAHLALNLVILLFCGRQVERTLGTAPFLLLYLVGAYAAAAGQWAIEPSSPMPTIGASGAISAVIATYALLFGQRRARAVGPVPSRLVNALWLAGGWVAIQLLVGYAGFDGAPVAIGAHMGGFLAGLLLTQPLLLWRYRRA